MGVFECEGHAQTEHHAETHGDGKGEEELAYSFEEGGEVEFAPRGSG